MKKTNVPVLFILAITLQTALQAQTDASALLDETTADETEVVTGTFMASRIITGHSMEQPAAGELEFRISHRFGRINEGIYEYFGLDQATIHFSLEYSPIDRLTLGFGRSNFKKTYDGFAKISILKQKKGKNNFPFSLTYLASMEVVTLKNEIPEYELRHRLSYVHQLLMARKFGKRLSLQLTPSYVHKNLVENADVSNDVWALGIGGRFKITRRLSLNAEWFVMINPNSATSTQYYNPLSIGIDLETGGHVFQIMITNAQSMREGSFISETTGSWANGDIHLGFNISRMFNLHN
jgi:hypothetical protein